MESPERALVAALLDPAAYGGAVAEVAHIETHISHLFFAGDRVYKVKKPIVLPFLDYGTVEKRRTLCEEEVRLNRRLAPRTYVGVEAISIDERGRARVGGAGTAVEHAVVMERLPAARMLDVVLARGEIDNEAMVSLADLLAAFHASAATGPGVDEHGAPAAVRDNAIGNFDETAEFVFDRARDRGPLGTISRRLHGFLRSRTEGFLDAHAGLLERRVREGRIRDGHGDLHAGNVCLAPEGIVIYDCIEFRAAFRCGDVACDLAFLLMDLDMRDFRAFGAFLARRYAEASRDEGLAGLLPFYKGYRACVRGKVASLRARGTGAAEAKLEAMRYFQLAAAYELPHALVLTCGLPASGKSFVARAIARPFEAVVLQSDAVRKRLAGVAPGARHQAGYLEGIYTPEHTARTYGKLLEDARQHLIEGRTVIVDATFAKRAHRSPFVAAASDLRVPLVVASVQASDDEVRARMERRALDPDPLSDADMAVYLRARETFELPVEIDPAARVDHDGARPGEEAASETIDRLIDRV